MSSSAMTMLSWAVLRAVSIWVVASVIASNCQGSTNKFRVMTYEPSCRVCRFQRKETDGQQRLSAKRGAYFCKSIAIEMGGVLRYFSRVSGSGVDSTLLNMGGVQAVSGPPLLEVGLSQAFSAFFLRFTVEKAAEQPRPLFWIKIF